MKEEFGLLLGLRTRTDEAIIGTDKGVARAICIRRLDESKGWYVESLRKMQGRPSSPVPGKPGDFIPVHVAEGVPRGIQTHGVDEPLLDDKSMPTPGKSELRPDVDMKRMTIRVPMFETYSCTDGCPGCRDVKARQRYHVHNDECRMTLREQMTRDPDGQQTLIREEQRQPRHFEKALERVMGEKPEIANAHPDHAMEFERMGKTHDECTIHTPMESPSKFGDAIVDDGMEGTDATNIPASRTSGKSIASSLGKWFEATRGKRTEGGQHDGQD